MNNKPKVTIISSIFGSLSTTKECIDSWFPIPTDWEMILYNNDVSKIDGTTEYIYEMKKLHNFKLIEDGNNRTHSTAIDVMLAEARSDWILHIDSDTKLLNHAFYIWAERAIKSDYRVWGRIEGEVGHFGWDVNKKCRRFSSKLQVMNGGNELYLMRAHPWLIMVNKQFLIDKNIDFGDFHMVGHQDWGAGIKHLDKSIIVNDTPISIFGDTGWQLYWESYPRGLFGSIPVEIAGMCYHKNNSSCKWLHDNDKKIQELYTNGIYSNKKEGESNLCIEQQY